MNINIEQISISYDNYLSYILVLDQFTRNVFRNNPKAFEGDKTALELSKTAIENNFLIECKFHYNSFF